MLRTIHGYRRIPMESSDSVIGFLLSVPEEVINREKEKARALRKTQWWQRRIARGQCHYCGKGFSACHLTMDHVVPLARGGTSTRGNVVPACKNCNNKKKYLLPTEWDDYMKSLSGHGAAEENSCRE